MRSQLEQLTMKKKKKDAGGHKEQQPEEAVPSTPVPVLCAVQELDSNLDGRHWGDGMVGSVIREYIIGSVIQDYDNVEATLSIPQYGFQKGLKNSKS